MQRELPVPDSLLEAGRALHKSPVHRPRSSRASMGDVYVRYVNIIATMKATWPLDMQWLLREVDDLDKALQAWRKGIYPDYDFTTIQGAESTAGHTFDLPLTNGKRHVYKVRWSAHIWNKWRIMCMMLYKLKLDYGILDTTQTCKTTIREASIDICLSVPSLLASSRKSWTLTLFSFAPLLILTTNRRTDPHLATIHRLSRGPQVSVLTVPLSHHCHRSDPLNAES